MERQCECAKVTCREISSREAIDDVGAPSRTSTGSLNLSKAPFFRRKLRNVS